ncbi:HNH endonuclease [Streptomyces sp. NPDC094438]|uniref:HNH endonuclease n=1 Tax=Streptomyces sp. NPDC094438 TaxID=3366061 RepID=UPI003807BCE4
MRKAVRKAGGAMCSRCRYTFLPSFIDVDHIVPLSRGGGDVAGNVQPLCKLCHKLKTREDFGHKTLPF